MTDFEKICDFLQNSTDQIIDLETKLCAIPAIAPESTGLPEHYYGELAKCEFLQSWLKQNGFTHFERFDAPDTRVKCGFRPNLLVTIQGKDTANSIWIMTHLDIVPAGELSLWKTDPFKAVVKDGKIYGRGVEDNQQGLCAGIFASLALLKNGIKPAKNIKLLFCADEEVGSDYGIQYLIKHHNVFKKNDLIIIPDGGDEKGASIEVAEKHLFWLRITTKGKQTHGSRPDQGNNAFLANCELALLLNKMEEDLTERNDLFEPNRSTLQPTKKEVNVPNINTIPGEDIFCMDCRILPCYTLDFLRKEVRKRMDTIESKYGVKIDYTEEQTVESPATPVDAPVVQVLSAAIQRVLGQKAVPIGIGGGTVASFLRKIGQDACVWSKLDETAHQPNENCTISNLIDEAKVLASVFIA